MSPSGWFTSSYSGGQNGCVEVHLALPADWRTSTYSNEQSGWVEVSVANPAAVGVRDTKDRGAGPVLTVDPARWAQFVAEVAEGRPHANDALTVIERAEARRYPARGDVLTRWHLRCLDDGTELHFDDREWDAFRRGAVDGEFVRSPMTAA